VKRGGQKGWGGTRFGGTGPFLGKEMQGLKKKRKFRSAKKPKGSMGLRVKSLTKRKGAEHEERPTGARLMKREKKLKKEKKEKKNRFKLKGPTRGKFWNFFAIKRKTESRKSGGPYGQGENDGKREGKSLGPLGQKKASETENPRGSKGAAKKRVIKQGTVPKFA